MIWIEMDIMALALGQAIPTDAAAASVAAPESGFAEALESIQQSGAPPGPPVPPVATAVGEEVANLGPNAQSLNPDFLPQADAATNTKASSDPALLITSNQTSATSEADTAPAGGPKSGEGVKPLTADEAALLISSTLNGSAFQVQAATGDPAEGLQTNPAVPQGTPPVAGKPPHRIDGNDVDRRIKTAATMMEGSEVCTPPETNDVWDLVHTKQVGRDVRRITGSAESLAIKAQGKLDLKDATKVEIFTQQPDGSVAGDASAASSLAAANSDAAAKLASSKQATPGGATAAGSTQAAEATTANAAGIATEDPAVSGLTRKSVAQSSKEEARSKTGPLDGDEVETTDNSLLADDSKQTVTPVKDAKEPIFADSKHHSNVTHSAEAAKVDPKAPLDRPEMHLVVKQIADRMELLAATRPKQGVTIQLQPEHLGEIVMTVKALGSSVDAQISASDERVRTALQQNGSMLVQAMNQRGIKLENVSISAQLQQSTSGHRDAAQQQQQQAQHQQAQQMRGSHTSSFGSSRTTHVSVADSRRMAASASGVDYWI